MGEGKCRIALIGTGNVANMHARAIERVPGARMVGGYNRTR